MNELILKVISLNGFEIGAVITILVVISLYMIVKIPPDGFVRPFTVMVPSSFLAFIAIASMEGTKLSAPLNNLQRINPNSAEITLFDSAVKQGEYEKVESMSNKWINPVTGRELEAIALMSGSLSSQLQKSIVMESVERGYLDRLTYIEILNVISKNASNFMQIVGTQK